jgi:hypothetical protein
VRVRLAVLLAIVAALAAAGVRAAPALADGDPASDVLVYQPVFYPYAPAPHALEHRLSGVVRSANQQGLKIRIAIIQSRRDLGAIPELFGKPSVYARFLGSELSSVWRGRVLIVMPNGYGLAQGAHLVRSSGIARIVASTGGPDALVLRHLARPAGSSPADLVAAAERAVRALAARHDVALVAASGTRPSSSGGRSRSTTAIAAAVSAVVGLAAGTLWFLWRTRPGRGSA